MGKIVRFLERVFSGKNKRREKAFFFFTCIFNQQSRNQPTPTRNHRFRPSYSFKHTTLIGGVSFPTDLQPIPIKVNRCSRNRKLRTSLSPAISFYIAHLYSKYGNTSSPNTTSYIFPLPMAPMATT